MDHCFSIGDKSVDTYYSDELPDRKGCRVSHDLKLEQT